MYQKKRKPLQWTIITNLEVAMNSGKYIGEVLIQPNLLHNSVHLAMTGTTKQNTMLVYVGDPTTEIRELFRLPKSGKFDRTQRRFTNESLHIRR